MNITYYPGALCCAEGSFNYCFSRPKVSDYDIVSYMVAIPYLWLSLPISSVPVLFQLFLR